MKTLKIIILAMLVTNLSFSQEFEDSPFAVNNFGVIFGAAEIMKITSAEQMANEIESQKIPYFKELGIRWARLHPDIFGSFGWSGIDPDYDGKNLDFSKQDALVLLAQENDIMLVASIGPLPINTEWLSAETYIPEDKNAYSSYVRQLVERYDGDGKDDMPGLKYPIKYWQLGNEPDLHNKIRMSRGNANFSSADEYFEVLKLTYPAIKDADKESKVMINLVGGGQSIGDISTDYLQRLNELGVGNYYDIFSYHIYPQSYDTSVLKDNLQKFQQLAGNKQFWITESGVNGKITEKSEKQQAGWLIKNYVFHTAGGVKKVFWFTLADMSSEVPEGMVAKYAGLLTSQSKTPKLSYYTYKKMTELLEGSDWNNIQTIQESNNVYIYRFVKNNEPIYVAWWDYFDDPNYTPGDTRPVTLTGLTETAVIVTDMVPDYNDGSEVTDYNSAFTVGIYPILDGSVTIDLGEDPLLAQSVVLADLDGDNDVDLRDFSIFAQNWLDRKSVV